jgi:PmbA protein
MDSLRQQAKYGLDSLIMTGAKKSQCSIGHTVNHEFNVENGKISLLRTTHNTSLKMDVIIDNKKGSIYGNQITKEAIDQNVRDVIDMANTSLPDTAHDISPYQPKEEFRANVTEPEYDLMYDRLTEFLSQVKDRYPTVQLGQSMLNFLRFDDICLNSNGVDFSSSLCLYRCSIMFSAKEGDKVSSFNQTGFMSKDLDRPMLEYGDMNELLRQITEQIHTNAVKGKFVGDVVIAPSAMNDFLYYLIGVISDSDIITETSPYQKSLNKQIASPIFTLMSQPISDELAAKEFYTSDGFKSENSVIVDKGTLKTFMLSLYGANKTVFPRAVNSGKNLVIPQGATSYTDMIKSVKRGILLVRFSGGSPSQNGDFSGVAKNSYYIEDGQIKNPLAETMVSGNMVEAFKSIEEISMERINDGVSILPWVKMSGLTVSGK